MSATSGTDPWEGAWSAALDRLELDVERTEQMLASLHTDADLPAVEPWVPPTGLGPVPVPLRDRAQALLERQIETARSVAAELATTSRQVAATRPVTRPELSRPLFVDQAL